MLSPYTDENGEPKDLQVLQKILRQKERHEIEMFHMNREKFESALEDLKMFNVQLFKTILEDLPESSVCDAKMFFAELKDYERQTDAWLTMLGATEPFFPEPSKMTEGDFDDEEMLAAGKRRHSFDDVQPRCEQTPWEKYQEIMCAPQHNSEQNWSHNQSVPKDFRPEQPILITVNEQALNMLGDNQRDQIRNCQNLLENSGINFQMQQ